MEVEEEINSLKEQIKKNNEEISKLKGDLIEAYKNNTKQVDTNVEKVDFDTYCREHYDKKKKK